MAVWDWRINGAQWDGFTYTMSYPSWIRMVDFAAEQGFRYLVLDANWYGPEFAAESDPLKGGEAGSVQKLIEYACNKGVGIWLLKCATELRPTPFVVWWLRMPRSPLCVFPKTGCTTSV